MKTKVFLTGLIAVYILINKNSFAQSLGINNTGAAGDASSILDLSSTSKGLLIPRMSQTQRNAISSPATGLMIYQTDNTPGFYYFNGTSWIQAIGPQGPAGATGPQGPAGANGTNGSNGTNGTDGKSVLNRTSNPTSGIGVDGDFFINTSSNTLFGPKASGSWPSGVSLVGPTGAAGATGPQGPTGATGATGATGPAGPAPSGTGIVTVNGGVLGTPGSLSGDVTTTGNGLSTTITNNAVTSAKIEDGTITALDIANNSVDGTKINIASNTAGDMMYYNGTDWVRVPAGTSGQLLQSNGTSAPTWVTKPNRFVVPFSNGSGTGSLSANTWWTVYDTRTMVSTGQGTSPDRSGAPVPTQGAFTFTATQACTMTGFRMWISNSTSNKIYSVAVYKYPIAENATVLGTGSALIASTNITVSPTVALGMTSVNITPAATTINPGEVVQIVIKTSSTANQTVYLNGAMEFTNQ